MKQRTFSLILAALLFAALGAGCKAPAAPDPTAAPTEAPAVAPASEPTAEPTPEPTTEPTPEPTSEPDPNYVAGTRTETTYESQWLGLRYTLAEDMVMTTDEEINALMDLGADVLELDESGKQIIDFAKVALVYEMMAVSTDGSRNIQIIAEKPALANMTAEQYIALMQTQLPSILEGVSLAEPTASELLGVTYQTLDYSMEITGGLTLSCRYMLRKQGDRMVSIILTAVDTAAIDAMLEGFAPLA